MTSQYQGGKSFCIICLLFKGYQLIIRCFLLFHAEDRVSRNFYANMSLFQRGPLIYFMD
jgi:hypothetical protein